MARDVARSVRAPLAEISVGDILGDREKEGGPESRGVRSLVLSFIRQNPDGVTLQMVASDASVSESWAQRILDDLLHQRELYSRVVPGVRATLYYPNGRLIHKYLQESREMGSQTFRVSVHEGRRGPRVQIQERRFTLLHGERVEGAIFLDLDNVDQLVDLVSEVVGRLHNQTLVSKMTRQEGSTNEKNRD